MGRRRQLLQDDLCRDGTDADGGNGVDRTLPNRPFIHQVA
jgi:hypothetical protein